jgi:hypothetical protein
VPEVNTNSVPEVNKAEVNKAEVNKAEVNAIIRGTRCRNIEMDEGKADICARIRE